LPLNCAGHRKDSESKQLPAYLLIHYISLHTMYINFFSSLVALVSLSTLNLIPSSNAIPITTGQSDALIQRGVENQGLNVFGRSGVFDGSSAYAYAARSVEDDTELISRDWNDDTLSIAAREVSDLNSRSSWDESMEMVKRTKKGSAASGKQDCSACAGDGIVPDFCAACNGAGSTTQQQGRFTVTTACAQCQGTGGGGGSVDCSKCKGTGKKRELFDFE